MKNMVENDPKKNNFQILDTEGIELIIFLLVLVPVETSS